MSAVDRPDGWPTEDICPECDVVRDGDNYCSDCGSETVERDRVAPRLPYQGSTGIADYNADNRYIAKALGFYPVDDYIDVIPEVIWDSIEITVEWRITEDFEFEIKSVSARVPGGERVLWSDYSGVEEAPERVQEDEEGDSR